jgi:hypothetical protein
MMNGMSGMMGIGCAVGLLLFVLFVVWIVKQVRK